MKIRKKITLWISGTTLLSTLAFSAFIFWEMMGYPFKLIDNELQYMSAALTSSINAADTVTGPFDLTTMPYNPNAYWIMVRDKDGRTVYRSQLAEITDLFIPGKKARYLIEKHIPRSVIWLGQDSKDDVLFRVMVIDAQINGRSAEIRIAKPIEGLEEELIAICH